jgi:putative ubiquitin-RnfH superfamily antitoxin RatB of RatAB toxin-antitoxin module
MVDSPLIVNVQVCYAAPQRQIVLDLTVPAGATLHQAIKSSGILQLVPEIDLSVWRVGVFSKLETLDSEVYEHDRIEIYRPLIADPMESRRRRAAKRDVDVDA